eukprot:32057-Chlamydomonas_euryale.AAC.1
MAAPRASSSVPLRVVVRRARTGGRGSASLAAVGRPSAPATAAAVCLCPPASWRRPRSSSSMASASSVSPPSPLSPPSPAP